jgi:replicative DNA helicase
MPDIPLSYRDGTAPKFPNTPEVRPWNVAEVVLGFDQRLRDGRLENYRPTPLGLPEIDACLGGGLRAEDLCLLGGMQNIGKTIISLQAARNLAVDGQVLPIVVCYEHSREVLLHRLLCMESIANPDDPAPAGVTRAEIERAVLEYYDAHPEPESRRQLNLDWMMRRLPRLEQSWLRLGRYMERLWLVHGDGTRTTTEWLHEYVRLALETTPYKRVLLIVDYAQRVPVPPLLNLAGLDWAGRIDFVMRALKGLATSLGVPVLAVAAADADGLRQQRVHFENLWGPATVQYEPDVALIVNRDTADAAGEARTVRVAIEKNRNGPSEVEFRHRLHGAYYCISRRGKRVEAGESYQTERIELRRRQQADARPGLDPTLAMLLTLAFERQTDSEGRSLAVDLLRRAITAEDGGVSLVAEAADRLGAEELVVR